MKTSYQQQLNKLWTVGKARKARKARRIHKLRRRKNNTSYIIKFNIN